MSPFIQMTINDSDTRDEVNDAVCNDIMENLALAKLSLDESQKITDINELNKKLEKKLAEEQELAAVMNEKTRQLSELNARLDLVIAKIYKDEKWIELIINENLKFELLNMSPKPDHFDEIKLLFDSTMNLHGLFSIYQWDK